MNRDRRDHVRITHENKLHGSRTVEISHELEADADMFLRSNTGKGLDETARRYRRNKRGRVTFKAGLGYDVIDEDLFGGDGTGDRLRKFNREMEWTL